MEPGNNGNLSLAENFLTVPGILSLEDPDFKYLYLKEPAWNAKNVGPVASAIGRFHWNL